MPGVGVLEKQNKKKAIVTEGSQLPITCNSASIKGDVHENMT
jgi:hypothetical protein